MVKYYCDACGNEIQSDTIGKRWAFKRGRIVAEVMVAIDNTWNGGHYCLDCLLDCINNGGRKLIIPGSSYDYE